MTYEIKMTYAYPEQFDGSARAAGSPTRPARATDVNCWWEPADVIWRDADACVAFDGETYRLFLSGVQHSIVRVARSVNEQWQ